MKVLLISPFFENSRYPLYMPSENLGLGYLAGMLRNHEVEVEVLDANMLEMPAASLPRVAQSDHYDVVGISIPFQSIVEEARQIAKFVKLRWPNCHVTVGGHFPTFRHKEILEAEPNVDSVVRGDGEDTLLALVNAIARSGRVDDVQGLCFRNSSREAVMNHPRPPRENLDTLPYPARDTLEYIRKLGHPWPTQICSSRGCYASCAFCDIRSFYGRTWRARDPVKLVDEIEWLHKQYGSRVFRFTDDEFIGPHPGSGVHGPRRASAIAREIMQRGLKVELMIDARPEAVEWELFQELKAAGAIDCLVGVESGIDRILKLFNKGATVSRNIRAIEILRSLGIKLNLGFIMFDPRMTFDELRANYRFLQENGVVTVDSLRSWLWPLFGTPVVDQLRAANLVVEETLGDVVYRFEDSVVERVFNVISHCTELTYPFDYAFFKLRKFNPILPAEAEITSRQNLGLWIDIFEAALEDPHGFDFSWVERRRDELLDKVKSLATVAVSQPPSLPHVCS